MDYVLKALCLNNEARVYIVNTKDMANEFVKRHDLWPSAASVLTKTATVATLMGAMLKGDQALTIKVNGGGPVGNVIVDANAYGEVRGYVDHPHVHFSRKNSLDDVTTLGNDGFIDVIKDLELKDLFTSTTPLITGDLAKDFTYYFVTSEQTPSVVSLGTLITEDNKIELSGGLIIQLLPNATESTIQAIESKVNELSHLSDLLFKYTNLEDILKLLFNNDYEILEIKTVRFNCNCSKEKFAGGIASLGKEEIKQMIEEDENAEVICHYCNNIYNYSKDELSKIMEGEKND